MRISLTIPGVPVAQPRQRTRVMMIGGKAIPHNFTPARDPVNTFKAAIREAAAKAHPGAPIGFSAIALTIRFIFPRPAGKTKRRGPNPRLPKVSKPDWDNLGKAVSDALNGIVYRDDAQVARCLVDKIVAGGDEQARTEVIIEAFNEYQPGESL